MCQQVVADSKLYHLHRTQGNPVLTPWGPPPPPDLSSTLASRREVSHLLSDIPELKAGAP